MVSARPARRRPCRSVSRAALGPAGVVRVRLRPRHPRHAAAPGPACGIHPRQPGRPGCAVARAGQLARHRGRRADRAPRPPDHGNSGLGERPGCAGGLCQPRRRPGGAGARRTGARPAGRHRRGHAHRQGPRGLRARRTAYPGRQSLQRVHTLQERLAEEDRPVLPEGLPGGPPCRRTGGAAGVDAPAAADAGRHRLHPQQPAPAEAAQRQRRRPGVAGRLPGRTHRPLSRAAATSRRSRGPAT